MSVVSYRPPPPKLDVFMIGVISFTAVYLTYFVAYMFAKAIDYPLW